ncbi:unnamed protein product [Calicophoron daubneyi]|uniref:Las1-like protein n=1 Tax=Calicophoron daubneyi TaxID=300641 RepID=A0AAV2TGI9_CALDB
MSLDARIVPWVSADEFRRVSQSLCTREPESLRYALTQLQMWMSRMPVSKIPRSISCTHDLLASYFERSYQGLALSLMRFVSLLSSEDQDRGRPFSAEPLLSLARKAGLPSWLADLRNDIAHGTVPSPPLIERAFEWAMNCLRGFWVQNANHLRLQDSNLDGIICSAMEQLTSLLKDGDSKKSIDAFERAIGDFRLAEPAVAFASRSFLTLAIDENSQSVLSIKAACRRASLILHMLKDKCLMHNFILFLMLNLNADQPSYILSGRSDWCLLWIRALHDQVLGIPNPLCRYMNESCAADFDWRRALRHVVIDNLCPEVRTLSLEIVYSYQPPLDDVKRSKIVEYVEVFLGCESSLQTVAHKTAGVGSGSQWSYASDVLWADKPLGSDLGEDASSSRQHKRLHPEDTTSRCKVRQDKGEQR